MLYNNINMCFKHEICTCRNRDVPAGAMQMLMDMGVGKERRYVIY